ncbi:hypothetical protein QZH41_020152 [Actinostola sp. cb2023]|nr:hypothetical protein QZH41_020152 [Actinostola sp. cb2023]
MLDEWLARHAAFSEQWSRRSPGLRSQLEETKEKLDEIRSSKAQQIARVNGADNPFLKERFQKILEGILDQEKEQEQEVQECSF